MVRVIDAGLPVPPVVVSLYVWLASPHENGTVTAPFVPLYESYSPPPSIDSSAPVAARSSHPNSIVLSNAASVQSTSFRVPVEKLSRRKRTICGGSGVAGAAVGVGAVVGPAVVAALGLGESGAELGLGSPLAPVDGPRDASADADGSADGWPDADGPDDGDGLPRPPAKGVAVGPGPPPRKAATPTPPITSTATIPAPTASIRRPPVAPDPASRPRPTPPLLPPPATVPAVSFRPHCRQDAWSAGLRRPQDQQIRSGSRSAHAGWVPLIGWVCVIGRA